MITAWMFYSLGVGSFVGAGAWVLERLLRAHRRPVRMIWAGAMVLSVVLPLGQMIMDLFPGGTGGPGAPAPVGVIALDPLAVQVGQESLWRLLDKPVVMGWVLGSLVLLIGAFLLLRRTHVLKRGWAGGEAEGRPVLISEDWGPAVVGFFRPEIVLPGWCRDLDAATLRLILEHEEEHLRAGDLRLMLSAGLLPILLPWNLPIWWQFARLRLAVEGDCDLRVLRRYPGRTRPYLELLLEVGRRVRGSQALATMLSEPEETLERRIRIMTMPLPKKPWVRGVVLTAVGAFLVALACSAPGPTGEDENPEQSATNAAAVTEPAAPKVLDAAPTFTPYTVRPDITNRADVSQALQHAYPPLLRDAGIGGTVQVWFFIDETGKVQKTQINESSGHMALDEAALRVAGAIEFTPAMNREKAVPVWISLPITFATAGTSSETKAAQAVLPSEARTPPQPVRTSGDIEAAPTFTPYTVRPDITNRADVARALEQEYPPLLRDAGIGGTVQVWFFIDETGKVQKTQINESSGHQALDEAALRVARAIEFTAAMNKDNAVPVWISLPITFTVR